MAFFKRAEKNQEHGFSVVLVGNYQFCFEWILLCNSLLERVTL